MCHNRTNKGQTMKKEPGKNIDLRQAIRVYRLTLGLEKAFAKSGYKATVAEILGFSGMSRRSFYEIFENVHQLIVRVCKAVELVYDAQSGVSTQLPVAIYSFCQWLGEDGWTCRSDIEACVWLDNQRINHLKLQPGQDVLLQRWASAVLGCEYVVMPVGTDLGIVAPQFANDELATLTAQTP